MSSPVILLVDDEPFNIAVLEQELEYLDYVTASASDGQEALEHIARQPPDLILLDIMMPVMDGFAVLSTLKADSTTRDIPVIIISALNDIQNVVKGIQLGAEDYLPKPFDSVLLEARVKACLEKKRFRDHELEYLTQVDLLTAAASAVESNSFDPASIDSVANREDSLGGLARVFQNMALEVRAREQRLRQQLAQVNADRAAQEDARAGTVAAFVPMDRRHALVDGKPLPASSVGAALFVDVSGFTKLSEHLAQESGPKRGAEELIGHLNVVFGALTEGVHRFRGSVASFSGDAMLCWFEGDNGHRAIACGLELQKAMANLDTIETASGAKLKLGIKAAVSAGEVQRILAGNPDLQMFEVLAGAPIVELAVAEQLARRGQVTVPRALAERLGSRITTAAWHTHLESGQQFGIVSSVQYLDPVDPWPAMAPGSISDDTARAWLAPAVHQRLVAGQSEFLADLRPATALFMQFNGIDFAHDRDAAERLNTFVRWVQDILAAADATLLQVTIGDKGSYLYAAFGAPIAHEDDALRAVVAGLELSAATATFPFLRDVQIGIASGEMRTGAYGGPDQRTYGVQGMKVNQAAYLMQHAYVGILCDEATKRAAASRFAFQPLPPIPGTKGGESIEVYRPLSASSESAVNSQLQRLSHAQQLVLKVASVIGMEFTLPLLTAIFPIEAEKDRIAAHLEVAEEEELISRVSGPDVPTYIFVDSVVQSRTYNLLLFAQRRGLHNAIAAWQVQRSDNAMAGSIADHLRLADETERAGEYYEIAAARAMTTGETAEAARLLEQSLAMGQGNRSMGDSKK